MKARMKVNWIKRIFNSIFTKLLLVLLVTGVCINLSVTGFIRHMFKSEEPAIHKGIIHHLNYIVEDLGNPPDPGRAERIAQESSIQIRYESPKRNWSTSGFFSLSPQLALHASRSYPNIEIGEERGSHIFVLGRGEGRFIFELGRGFTWDILSMGAVVRLVALLTAILAGAYLLIRWTLSPVRGLTEGVKEVSKGNLDYRVLLRRSDELGELGKAFNAMTDRIRNMLRAKEQLMLDVSHELRSPLTRIRVALESLSESHVKKSIKEDIAEMEKMVTEVLEAARTHYMHGQLNLQRINMMELLNGVIYTFKGQPPGIQLENVPGRVELYVDPDRVKSVLKNVIDNALKYSSKSAEPVKIALENHKPYVAIRIRDSGAGIPQDELPYIFEPFYRVDKSRSKDTGGYGLGLSLCKTVMEAHRGKIEIESSLNKGTTVSLFFPHLDRGEPSE
jgi:signal transduction histidine kinase